MADTETETTPEILTDWRPPGWHVGDEDDPYLPEKIEELYREYLEDGYYASSGKTMNADLVSDKFYDDAEAVLKNRKLLRDAWNTYAPAWLLYAALIGREVKVDPFYNEGTQGLPGLVRTLDGLLPEDDGFMTVADARERLKTSVEHRRLEGKSRDIIEFRLESFYDSIEDNYPVNWRGDLTLGSAPAAANGPHSRVRDWLKVCPAYGKYDFVGAFVPDNGDGWFCDYVWGADLIVKLNRVSCSPPPGIKASSPRGASALAIWIPDVVKVDVAFLNEKLRKAKGLERKEIEARLDALLPAPTRRVLETGQAFRVPFQVRVKRGVEYALVQRSGIDLSSDSDVVDFGLLGGEFVGKV